MKKLLNLWVPAALLLALAAHYGSGAYRQALDTSHMLRLVGAAVATAALAVALCFRQRWTRWIAIGWAIDVLGNLAAALVFDDRPRASLNSYGHVSFFASGAALTLVLLGRPSARQHFEPDWTTPIHRAYRWSAIGVSACVTQATVVGLFGFEDGVWSAVVAALWIVLAIALLSSGRIAGLPAAIGALVAYALASDLRIPYFHGPADLRSWSTGTEGWTFFIGGASTIAWIPALLATVGAHLLALPHLARRYGMRSAGIMVAASIGLGVALGFSALIPEFTRTPESLVHDFPEFFQDPRYSASQYDRYRRLRNIATERELVALTRSDRPAVRVYAVMALFERREPSALSALLDRIGDDERVKIVPLSKPLSHMQPGPIDEALQPPGIARAFHLMLIHTRRNRSEADNQALAAAGVTPLETMLIEKPRGYPARRGSHSFSH